MEDKINCDNRGNIKKIFSPENLYPEVKTIFNDIDVSSVKFVKTTYMPDDEFVGKKIHLDDMNVNLKVAFAKQFMPIEYVVLAPDYEKALSEFIQSKKANNDEKPFAIHLVRLPNGYDKKLLQKSDIKKLLLANNQNTLFGVTAEEKPVTVTLAASLVKALGENKIKQPQSFQNRLWSPHTQGIAKLVEHPPSGCQGQSHHPASLSPLRK